MNRNEILLLVNTVVLVNKQGGRYTLSDDIRQNIKDFCDILSTMYTVNRRIKIDKVTLQDVIITKTETPNSPCSYNKYILSLLHIFDLMKKNDNVLKDMMQTGYTAGRLSSTLKTFFLIYAYGGVEAIINYINIFYSMVICPDTTNLSKFVTDNVICLSCRPITKLEEEDFVSTAKEGLVNSTIFIDYVKTSKEYKIPLAVFPESFYMDCTNSMIPIFLKKKLISKTFFNGVLEDDIKNLSMPTCETSKLSGIPTEGSKDVKRFIDAHMKNIDDVTKLLATESIKKIYSDANLEDRHICQVLELFKEIPPNFSTILNTHFTVLELLKHGHCDIDQVTEMEKKIYEHLPSSKIYTKLVLLNNSVNYELNDYNRYKLNYTIRKCYFNYILYKFRYEFLAISGETKTGIELTKSNIYFEDNNFSTVFDGTVLSDDTSQGVVWKLDIRGASIATLKYSFGPRDNVGFHNIIHELVVGLVLNQLKDIVPNFMYTWGGFICSPPKRKEKLLKGSQSIKYDYTFGEMCNNNAENSQIIVLNEFVEGQSLESMLKAGRLTTKDIRHIMFQLACSIYLAQQHFSFQHNDLHAGNILIKTLPNPHEFKYDTMSITSLYMPVIIDYGYATLSYKNNYLHGMNKSDIANILSGQLMFVGSMEDIQSILSGGVESAFPYTFSEYKITTIQKFIEDLYKDISTQL